ncbi:hypothetical protein BJV78DRAFT_657817 [Lactifluus subvellereus]|nr:hypothetical protein BJV78DRAFT_657817 [Lactifluus subvellereus]
MGSRHTSTSHLLIYGPTGHLQASVALHYGPIAADLLHARDHVRHRHIYHHVGADRAAVGNVSQIPDNGATLSGRENGCRQGCGGDHANAGIRCLEALRDLQCHRSGTVWVKGNGCRGGGAQVFGSGKVNHRDIGRRAHDAAPCAPPFLLS